MTFFYDNYKVYLVDYEGNIQYTTDEEHFEAAVMVAYATVSGLTTDEIVDIAVETLLKLKDNEERRGVS